MAQPIPNVVPVEADASIVSVLSPPRAVNLFPQPVVQAPQAVENRVNVAIPESNAVAPVTQGLPGASAQPHAGTTQAVPAQTQNMVKRLVLDHSILGCYTCKCFESGKCHSFTGKITGALECLHCLVCAGMMHKACKQNTSEYWSICYGCKKNNLTYPDLCLMGSYDMSIDNMPVNFPSWCQQTFQPRVAPDTEFYCTSRASNFQMLYHIPDEYKVKHEVPRPRTQITKAVTN